MEDLSENGTLDDLVDELARVLHHPEVARALVVRAGFPPEDLPVFDIPRVFWTRVIGAAANGKIRDGVQTLISEAVVQFPGNSVFVRHEAEVTAHSRKDHSGLGFKRDPLLATESEDASYTFSSKTKKYAAGLSVDVVIAHVLEDTRIAIEFKKQLQDKDSQTSVILDSELLSPPRSRYDSASHSLEAALVIIALISNHCGKYQYRESSLYYAMLDIWHRHSQARVFPVYIDKIDKNHVIGLERLRSFDLTSGHAMEGIATDLISTLLEQKGTIAPGILNANQQELECELRRAEDDRAKRITEGLSLDKTLDRIAAIKSKLRQGGIIGPGDTLGHYKLIAHIGDGGFASVFSAYDAANKRLVAAKVLHPRVARDRSCLERFARGAREMKALSDEGVTGVVRVYEEPNQDFGYWYYAMELLPNGDFRNAILHSHINQRDALWLIVEIGATLHYAHSKRIIHRDVKPGNILLDRAGNARLTDFDLAWAPGTSGGTRTGALGTFIYAAPEALSDGSNLDARADVFSLAMTAVFILHGSDLPSNAFMYREEFLGSIGCRPDLRQVLLSALSLSPAERTQSAQAFSTQLQRVLEDTDDAPLLGKDYQNENTHTAESGERLLRLPLASLGLDLKEAVKQGARLVETELIVAALEQTQGNVTRSARLLGISRRSLQAKMKELGLRSTLEEDRR